MSATATTALLVALTGAVGSVSRWAISSFLQKPSHTSFPVGTMVVNLLGSTLIGTAMAYFATRGQLDSRMRIALTGGLLGGFTTYSSFAFETLSLIEKRAFVTAALNVFVTVVVCLVACAVGFKAGRWLAG